MKKIIIILVALVAFTQVEAQHVFKGDQYFKGKATGQIATTDSSFITLGQFTDSLSGKIAIDTSLEALPLYDLKGINGISITNGEGTQLKDGITISGNFLAQGAGNGVLLPLESVDLDSINTSNVLYNQGSGENNPIGLNGGIVVTLLADASVSVGFRIWGGIGNDQFFYQGKSSSSYGTYYQVASRQWANSTFATTDDLFSRSYTDLTDKPDIASQIHDSISTLIVDPASLIDDSNSSDTTTYSSSQINALISGVKGLSDTDFPYTVQDADKYLIIKFVSETTTDDSLFLPNSPATDGRIIIIKNASDGSVTLSQNIFKYNGADTSAITLAPGDAIKVISLDNAWYEVK